MIKLKEINRYTSNEFHDWQREKLPKNFIIQDVDTWALTITDNDNEYEPLFLLELKRSFIPPEAWTPFKKDLPNYLALYKLAIKAKIPLLILYFKKGEQITNKSIFALFNVLDVNNKLSEWIQYKKILLSAEDFIEKFPNLI